LKYEGQSIDGTSLFGLSSNTGIYQENIFKAPIR